MTQDFIGWFHSVAPYIHAHRGKMVVVACPGEAFLKDRFINLSYDLSLLSSLGMKIVLVHGARPQIEFHLNRLGIPDVYHKDKRVTSEAALMAIKEAVGALKIDIEARLSIGLMHSPMQNAALRVSSGNSLIAKPLGVVEGIDFQYTGTVRKVDSHAILAALEKHQLVLVSPIGYSPSGEAFNLPYEEAAARVSMALRADKLIYLMTQDFPEPLPQQGEFTINQIECLYMKEGISESVEVLPVLNEAIKACRYGTERVHLIPLSIEGSLLLELFTHRGIGWMLTKDPAETIRKATIDDIAGILRIIEPLEQQGVLVRRDRQQLEQEINRFIVIEHDHRILGCMALYPLDEDKAELACFAVHPDHRQEGYASQMLEYILSYCRQKGIRTLFVLTTQTTHWFIEHGFHLAEIEALPSSKRVLYNWQRASKILIYELNN